MVGLLLGQYILPFGNAATQTLFIICAIIYASALLPTALSSAQSPNPLTQVSLDLKGLYRRSPAAVVGSFIAGIVAGTWNFLAAIYGEMNGLSTFGIATMLASAMIGGAIFQYPLGRASDFVDRRYMMIDPCRRHRLHPVVHHGAVSPDLALYALCDDVSVRLGGLSDL